MIEKQVYDFLALGANHEFLERIVTPGTSVWNDVISIIDDFSGNLEQLGLTVTLRASEELLSIRERLATLPKDAVLDQQQVDEIKSTVVKIWPTLEAEARGMVAYIVSERRFPIERLLGGVGGLFAKGIFEKLLPLAQQDFHEATRCLAFERPTAAAFHMLRATESVLRDYYCKKVHRKRTDLMWGAMAAEMRKFPRKFPAALVNHLDHIRSSFRNPTAHPDKTYDIDEAQDLLSICIDVSNRMVLDAK